MNKENNLNLRNYEKTGTAYLAAKGFTEQLRKELKGITKTYSQLILTDQPVQKSFWSQNIWKNPMIIPIKSINDAEDNTSNFTGHGIEGFSSDRVRHFLNNLCSYEDTKYLEVGVYKGSTFCAAIQNNDVTAYSP